MFHRKPLFFCIRNKNKKKTFVKLECDNLTSNSVHEGGGSTFSTSGGYILMEEEVEKGSSRHGKYSLNPMYCGHTRTQIPLDKGFRRSTC